MQAVAGIPSRMALGQHVGATSYADAARRVLDLARAGKSRYVCVSNASGARILFVGQGCP